LKLAREMVDNGVPYVRIARGLGISQTTLRQHFGPSPVESGLEFAQERAQAASARALRGDGPPAHEGGLRNEQIAARMGISQERVWAQMGPTPKRLGGRPTHDPGLRERARYLADLELLAVRDRARDGAPEVHDLGLDQRSSAQPGSRNRGVKVEPAIDENGAPLLLVAGAAREVPTRSGNPAHQVASGQFGAHGKKKDGKEPQSAASSSA
jgi:hypothetical protein